MADLRLITILPTQTVTGVQQPQGAPGAGAHPSAAISTLAPGSVISGFIINRDASGNPILRTISGDVTFSSAFFLRIGSEVVIRVESQAGNSQAHILSVDGQPPEIAATLSSFAEEPNILIGQRLAPQEALLNQTQATSPATAAQPPSALNVTGTLIAPSSTSTLPPGTQVSISIVNVTPPAPAVPEDIALAAGPQTAAQQPSLPAASAAYYSAYARAAGAPAPIAAAPAADAPAAPGAPQAPTAQAPQPTAAITIPSPASTTPATQPSAPASATTSSLLPQSAAATPAQPAAPAQTTVISTATAAPPPSPATTTAPAASTVAVTAPPSTAAPPSALNSLLPSAPAATPPPATSAITVPASAPPPAPAGVAMPVVTPAVAPLPPNSAANTLFSGQSVTATVIANDQTGESLVQTPAGIVRLPAGTELPSGSSITFTVRQVLAPSTPVASTTTAAAPLTELAQHWTSLKDIFSLLITRDTAQGNSFTPPAMPSLPAAGAQPQAALQNIPAGLMLFMAALKGGDFASWLGQDNVRWLDSQGQGDLVKKAAAEFTVMARQFNETPPQHWQATFFPVAVAGELQQARLFVKRDRKQGSGQQQGKKTDETRFVIEMDLTQLGEMQLDGFVRQQDQGTQFDLVIRSLSPLGPDIQQGILQIYNDAAAITGFKGALNFQAVREFPVNPMEEIAARMNTVVA